MDIKEKIEEVVKKVASDEKLRENFMKDPVKTVEGIVGVDLPDDQINNIIDVVKAKVSIDKLSDGLGKLLGK